MDNLQKLKLLLLGGVCSVLFHKTLLINFLVQVDAANFAL